MGFDGPAAALSLHGLHMFIVARHVRILPYIEEAAHHEIQSLGNRPVYLHKVCIPLFYCLIEEWKYVGCTGPPMLDACPGGPVLISISTLDHLPL